MPVDYINKINNNTNFDQKKTFDYEYQHKDELNYLCNNHILNEKTYQLLKDLNYKLNDSVKNFYLYFIGHKKILLFLDKNENGRDLDQIGIIDNKGIFIPEYLLKYKENNISLNNLNQILKSCIFNIYLNNNDKSYELKIEQIKEDSQDGSKKETLQFGYCYKLKDTSITTNGNTNEGETLNQGNVNQTKTDNGNSNLIL